MNLFLNFNFTFKTVLGALNLLKQRPSLLDRLRGVAFTGTLYAFLLLKGCNLFFCSLLTDSVHSVSPSDPPHVKVFSSATLISNYVIQFCEKVFSGSQRRKLDMQQAANRNSN